MLTSACPGMVGTEPCRGLVVRAAGIAHFEEQRIAVMIPKNTSLQYRPNPPNIRREKSLGSGELLEHQRK